MPYRVKTILATVAIAFFTGCTGSAPFARTGSVEDQIPGNAIVFDASRFGNEHGSLLDVMIGRVTSLKVDRRGSCPVISLRGNQNSVPGITDPLVYVDGTRTVDTCILSMLRAADVDRVEIYPLGYTTRPGYATAPHGLILVFMRNH